MPAPVLASLDQAGDRFYTFGDPPESFWSVTTIIGGGVPKYLHAHYAKMAADLALEGLTTHGPHARSRAAVRRWADLGRTDVITRQAAGQLTSIKLNKLTDLELAARWLKGAADRHRDAAADLGIEVHDEAEQLVLQHARESARLYVADEEIRPWPARLEGHQKAFVAWLNDWHPEFLATEATVLNRSQAYGGTLDAIVRATLADASRLVIATDYKSGRQTYPEVAMQLAAYSRGEFIAAPDRLTELPLPSIDAGAVLHLRADGTYRFRLVRIDDPIYDAFRFAREVFRWRKDISRTAFLQDLIAPASEEVA